MKLEGGLYKSSYGGRYQKRGTEWARKSQSSWKLEKPEDLAPRSNRVPNTILREMEPGILGEVANLGTLQGMYKTSQ